MKALPGIKNATLANLRRVLGAIKTGAVRDFLDNSVISYQTSDPVAELKTAEIAKNARAYTMLISCSVKADEASKR
jgi:hypothetical protein